MVLAEGPSCPGRLVELRAGMDVLVALSNCPSSETRPAAAGRRPSGSRAWPPRARPGELSGRATARRGTPAAAGARDGAHRRSNRSRAWTPFCIILQRQVDARLPKTTTAPSAASSGAPVLDPESRCPSSVPPEQAQDRYGTAEQRRFPGHPVKEEHVVGAVFVDLASTRSVAALTNATKRPFALIAGEPEARIAVSAPRRPSGSPASSWPPPDRRGRRRRCRCRRPGPAPGRWPR